MKRVMLVSIFFAVFQILSANEGGLSYAGNFSSVDFGFDFGIDDQGSADADFFDFDNDNDLDIIVACFGIDWDVYGLVDGLYIFKNDGMDNFSKIEIPGFKKGYFSFGDYDNDGFIDILHTGKNSGGVLSVTVLRNNSGSGTFESISTGISGNNFYSAEFGDYDNDGDLDIGVCDGVNSKIYENRAGIYTATGIIPSNTALTKMHFFDFDNDGDTDFLVRRSNLALDIYVNENNTFTLMNTGFSGTFIDWGDYDRDGDFDLLAGTSILKNNNGIFEKAAQLDWISGSGVWIDYDNDNDLDIVVSGSNGDYGQNTAILYVNNSGNFSQTSINIATTLHNTSLSTGDYNKDGKLDIFQSGQDADTDNLYVFLFKNLTGNGNPIPPRPVDLVFNSYNDKVTLSWDDPYSKISKESTAVSSLTYNIAIGTDSLCSDFVSPLSGLGTGFRRIPELGNTGFSNFYETDSLAPGVYYWAVQSVDNIYSGSLFAEIRSFIFELPPESPVALDASDITISGFTANWSGSENADGYFVDVASDSLFNNFVSGYENYNAGNVTTLQIRNVEDDTAYFYRIRAYNTNGCPSPNSNIVSVTTMHDVFELQIQIQSGTVNLSWLPVQGAISYKIYGSDSPGGVYADITKQGVYNGTSWSQAVTVNKLFYYVVAVTAGKK